MESVLPGTIGAPEVPEEETWACMAPADRVASNAAPRKSAASLSAQAAHKGVMFAVSMSMRLHGQTHAP